jgi:hypothetical protein
VIERSLNVLRVSCVFEIFTYPVTLYKHTGELELSSAQASAQGLIYHRHLSAPVVDDNHLPAVPDRPDGRLFRG